MPFENEKVEEDMIPEELSEDDASKGELSEAVVPVETSVDETSAAKVSEEEVSLEVLLEAEVLEDDELPGAMVPEEDALVDESSAAKISEEAASVKELSEAEAPEDDELSGAKVLEEESSMEKLLEAEEDYIAEEEALLEDNLSEEEEDDRLEEKLLDNDIESLMLESDLKNPVLIRMVNPHVDQNEIKLVRSVLRKATSLNKLLLDAAKRYEQGEPLNNSLDELHSIETKLLLLGKASANVQIILRDSDDPATQPVYSEVITELFSLRSILLQLLGRLMDLFGINYTWWF